MDITREQLQDIAAQNYQRAMAGMVEVMDILPTKKQLTMAYGERSFSRIESDLVGINGMSKRTFF